MTYRSAATILPCGFTLVELLVCIAVIGILAALLVPALAGAKLKGQSIYCLNNLRQISLANLIYTDDFQDRLPYNMGAAEIIRTVGQKRYLNWTSPVLNWELDADNTNTVLLTQGGLGPYTGSTANLYRCPSDLVVSDIQAGAGWQSRVRSISMNAMVGDASEFVNGTHNVNNPYYRQFFKLSQIPQPSQIFIFVEEHPDSINDGYFLNRFYSHKWTDLPASYHKGAANLTFADGHAEKHAWHLASTKPPSRPDAARLPFSIPPAEEEDFEWLMDRAAIEEHE